MCHSNLEIEFGDHVNFITGQNGSGKSAILTALCVAFGCRAKGTQRASTLKDFIKTGCSYASVTVQIKNRGEDAFKPETYGSMIILERRISATTSSTILKDHQGKKVAQRKDELKELVEHFNIDVENPCVIMSQDKSREFLHSGNDKDKFKFFFKATLLQQVCELLQSIQSYLNSANACLDELELSIMPIQKEIEELQEKIKNMEQIEEIAQQVQILKKKLAWAWVYDVDKQIQEQDARLRDLRDRVPKCQERIDQRKARLEELKTTLHAKKTEISLLIEKTSEVRKMKDELQQKLSSASQEKRELDSDHARVSASMEKTKKHVSWLKNQINDIQEQHTRNTQAQESELERQLKKIQEEILVVESRLARLQQDENTLMQNLSVASDAVREISKEIEDSEKKYRDMSSQISDLHQRRKNKVTAFGGERVLNLLRSIERHHRGFSSPPVGPIGAHVTLTDGEWARAVENALGKLLDAFIVTCHKDMVLLRSCAREANYANLQILIYDFSKPRYDIPKDMLPLTSHPTILSVLDSENATVMNILVDMGSIERQVLVKDYEMGKSVAFMQRIQNLKDVYTSDGFRMFRRGPVETTLPPNKRIRSGRLCGSVDEQISICEDEALNLKQVIKQGNSRKRSAEEEIRNLNSSVHDIKRRRIQDQTVLRSLEAKVRDLKNSYASEHTSDPEPNVEELHQEIASLHKELQEKEISLEKIKANIQIAEVKVKDMKHSLDKLCDEAKGEVDELEQSERALLSIEREIQVVEEEKAHYEAVMKSKVLNVIDDAEKQHEKLQIHRQESHDKASIICTESEVEVLGGCNGCSPEKLSNQLERLRQRHQNEAQKYSDSIDDLRAVYAKKERKIMKKQKTYASFREKLAACQKALDARWSKFHKNANYLKQELTWKFNAHLRKKGISGVAKVDYEQRTLAVEVRMPQDASRKNVRDTRGLSGGERSFSTLCFAMALHNMTEAPFRAMDEFDVFMDAVSRKISLDTLVDFAVSQGSQWIFITPHDISTVKPSEKIKKQQMAAPRG